MRLDLSYRFDDLSSVFSCAEQHWMGKPHSFPCGTDCIRELCIENGFSCLTSFLRKAPEVLAGLEQVEFMDWWVAGLGRDPFRFQRLDELLDGQPSKG